MVLAIVIAIASIALALSAWFAFGRKRYAAMRQYIEDVQTCGYLAPPPTEKAVRRLRRIARVVLFLQVGRLTVRGRENLDKPDGPMIVTPNHPHFADVAVLPLVLNRKARYMAARGVMKFGWGLGGLLTGPLGAFAADLDKGKGGPARQAAVRVLVTGQTLGMFPEGWAYLDGHMGDMKKGAVRIAKEAAAELGQETYVVPTFFRYGRYPGSWILKVPPPLEYLVLFLLAWRFRRGVTVVVGEPIAASAFPDDDAEATELLRQHIVALDPAGKNGRP